MQRLRSPSVPGLLRTQSAGGSYTWLRGLKSKIIAILLIMDQMESNHTNGSTLVRRGARRGLTRQARRGRKASCPPSQPCLRLDAQGSLSKGFAPRAARMRRVWFVRCRDRRRHRDLSPSPRQAALGGGPAPRLTGAGLAQSRNRPAASPARHRRARRDRRQAQFGAAENGRGTDACSKARNRRGPTTGTSSGRRVCLRGRPPWYGRTHRCARAQCRTASPPAA